MSRRKKILPIDLSGTVEELLKEYGDQVYEVMDDAIKETSEEARNELRSVNQFSPRGNVSGAYSQSWEYEKQKVNRLEVSSVVYNEDHYRLTHLLESGHAKFLWGRETGEKVQGYPHIEPVNNKAQKTLIDKVEKGVGAI